MRLVEVRWADCYTHCGQAWHTREELDKAATGDLEVLSVGYVFKEDDRNLTLVMSQGAKLDPDAEDEYGLALTIPKPMVLEVRDVVVLLAGQQDGDVRTQDAEVFDLVNAWAKAPTTTASAEIRHPLE
jgi:hypothetical protein